MNWSTLKTEQEWDAILERSATVPQLVYKHSTQCDISSMIKNRLAKKPLPEGIEFHYLDLIAYRSLSNKIAQVLGVRHESPQVLLIRDGKCIFHESHMAIRMDDIEAEAMS